MEHPAVHFKGGGWEAEKKANAGYSQEQVVRALITEIDLDRGTLIKNKARDRRASELFHALDLPPMLVCQELDKTQSPQRKVSLMRLLQKAKNAEVVQALLRQLDDRRPAVEGGRIELVGKPFPLRVCDIAINSLAYSFGLANELRATFLLDYAQRDEIIQEVLAELKLTKPE